MSLRFFLYPFLVVGCLGFTACGQYVSVQTANLLEGKGSVSSSGHRTSATASDEAVATGDNNSTQDQFSLTDSQSKLLKKLADPGLGLIDSSKSTLWARLKVFWKLFVFEAQAKVDSEATATLSDSDMIGILGKNDPALPFVKPIRSLKIRHRHRAPASLELQMRSGQVVSAITDSDWKRACSLIDQSLGTGRSLLYEVVDSKTKRRLKFRHPFEGKSCSQENLARFQVYNFDEGNGPAREVPDITLLISREGNDSLSTWAFFHDRDSKRNEARLAATLRPLFKDALLQTGRLVGNSL